MPTWRICQTIKSFFSRWSATLFSWPSCLIQGWHGKEKLDASHSQGLKVNHILPCYTQIWCSRKTCELHGSHWERNYGGLFKVCKWIKYLFVLLVYLLDCLYLFSHAIFLATVSFSYSFMNLSVYFTSYRASFPFPQQEWIILFPVWCKTTGRARWYKHFQMKFLCHFD